MPFVIFYFRKTFIFFTRIFTPFRLFFLRKIIIQIVCTLLFFVFFFFTKLIFYKKLSVLVTDILRLFYFFHLQKDFDSFREVFLHHFFGFFIIFCCHFYQYKKQKVFCLITQRNFIFLNFFCKQI